MLATSIDADEDTPFPSGTAEETWSKNERHAEVFKQLWFELNLGKE